MKFLATFVIVTILVTTVILSLWKIVFPFCQARLKKKILPNTNRKECEKLLREQWWRNHTDYFWSEPSRFVWISIILLFLIALSISIGGFWGLLFGVIFAIGASLFFRWAYISYHNYPKLAKAQLEAFEKAIIDGVNKEISFEGDNIQRFSNEDKEFDTAPKVFTFPVETVKLEYPLYSGNKTIISEQKLEFLILSREYLSICQGATKFNLLEPKRADEKKKCAEIKGVGECHEYYYSQIKNVKYEEGGIKIISHNNEELAFFKCKKDPKAMKALHEKLRLTERQKLKKIDEQYYYESIKEKRTKEKES